MGLTLLAQAQLPFKLWWDAFHTIVYHIKRLSSPVIKFLTPFKKVFKHKPDCEMLKCFGCTCYPYLRDYNKYKFAYHSNKCIFIGYSPCHKWQKCLHSSRQVYVARHVIFDEFTFLYASKFVLHSHTKSNSHPSNSFTPQQVYHLATLPTMSISSSSSISNPISGSFENNSLSCS